MNSGVIDWAVQTATFAGQAECGDRCLVLADESRALLAVVDGLGHGAAAAAAAQKAIGIIERQGAGVPLPALVERCHAGLQDGRGAVMSLALIEREPRRLSWLGIGNVRGELRRPSGAFGWQPESLLLRGGIVGRRLPTLGATTAGLIRGDLLLLATDGIAGDFADGLPPEWPPQRIADELVARFSTRADDALVLVARYRG